jgi:hypothetical protein
MKSTQADRLFSLRGAQQFLAQNVERLPQAAESGARHRLDQIVMELGEFVADQAGSTFEAQGATRRLHAMRLVLIQDHMAPIVSIARVELGSTPEMVGFRLPRGTPSVPKLAAAAMGMADAAVPHAAVFVQAGLPHDFIARLIAAADAVVEAKTRREQCRGRVSGATTGIGDRLSAGRRVVDVLHTFVRTATRDEPGLLADWRSVRAVRARTGRPSRRSAGDGPLTPVPGGAEMATADRESEREATHGAG